MDRPEEPLFEEMKRYVGFGAEDEARLTALGPRVEPRVDAIIDNFYAHVLGHPGARRSITGGDPQVERLKGTLRVWLRGVFTPPWDVAYYERRARIGRRHVEIDLPQQYMFTAVNVVRRDLVNVVMDTAIDRDAARAEIHALDKLLDMELAIMLHTYREDGLERLRRGERLAAFGQVVASIAHELRNPLGVIESSLFLLRKRVGANGDPVTRHLDKIESQVRISNRIITNLLSMVRDRPPEPRAVSVRDLVASALETVAPGAATITQDVPASPTEIFADVDQARQILVNLLSNAVDAAGARGTVSVTARADGAGVVIAVGDSGPGISAAIRARLFEPLVTTKARGIGLGLALCRRLAERNLGRIYLAEGNLPGATFEVWLPGAPEDRGEA